jgi:hypothetical protein
MIYVAVGCQAALVGVFFFSIAGKVRNRHAYDEFVSSVIAMQVLPQPWTRLAAIATIAAEVATLVLLAIPATVPAGFLVAAGLLTVFTSAILTAIRRGRGAPCRCFGASTTPLGRIHVVRNLVLLAACLVGLASIANGSGNAPHPSGLLISLGAAAITLLFVLRLDDLVSLFGSNG